jgi:hypothetical protein
MISAPGVRFYCILKLLPGFYKTDITLTSFVKELFFWGGAGIL